MDPARSRDSKSFFVFRFSLFVFVVRSSMTNGEHPPDACTASTKKDGEIMGSALDIVICDRSR
jgi:hypothetical protein